jgi:hypothetical protein
MVGLWFEVAKKMGCGTPFPAIPQPSSPRSVLEQLLQHRAAIARLLRAVDLWGKDQRTGNRGFATVRQVAGLFAPVEMTD